jgi:hypothetical protein
VLAAAAAQAAAQPTRIIIGYTVGIIVTPAVRNLRHRHPDADVQTLHLAWNEPREALLGHRVDAAVTRLPLQTGGLHVTILYDEPRVVMVPAGLAVAIIPGGLYDGSIRPDLVTITEAGRVSTFAVAPGSTSTSDGGPLSSAMKDPAGTVTVSPRPFGRAKCQAPRRIRCASTRSPLSRSPVVRPVDDPP